MGSGKVYREIRILNGARALLNVLEPQGLRCIFVGETAAFLYGGRVPIDLDLVVVPQTGIRSPLNITGILCGYNSSNFQFCVGQSKKKKGKIRYIDITGQIPGNRKKDVYVDIAIIRKVLPSYEVHNVVEVQNFPCVDLVVLINDFLRSILGAYESSRSWSLEDNASINPSKVEVNKPIKFLLPLLGKKFAPQDLDSANEALSQISRLMKLLRGKLPDIIKASNSRRLFQLLPRAAETLQKWINSYNATINLDGVEIVSNEETSDSDAYETDSDSDSGESIELEVRNRLNTLGGHLTTVDVQTDTDAPHSSIQFSDGRDPSPGPVNSSSSPCTPSANRVQFLFDIAMVVVDILDKLGIPCAIFGSLGCSLYGLEWTADVIDILVFPFSSLSTQMVKEVVYAADRQHFGLSTSLDDSSLYYRTENSHTPAPAAIQVNFALQETLFLPAISKQSIEWLNDLPVVPYSLLVVDKLYKWAWSMRLFGHQHESTVQCAGELLRLLNYVRHIDPSIDLENQRNLDTQGPTRAMVDKFCSLLPLHIANFKLLGFL